MQVEQAGGLLFWLQVSFVWLTFLGTIIGSFGQYQNVNILGTGISISIILVFVYAGLFIWQILDARACAQKYNESLQQASAFE